MEIRQLISNSIPANMYCLISGDEFLVVDCGHSLAELKDLMGEFDFLNSTMLKNSKIPTFKENYSQNEAHSTMHSTQKLICKGVFITHCHFDHNLYLDEFKDAGACFFMSKQCYENLGNFKINGTEYFLSIPKEYHLPESQVIILEENDTVKIDNETLTFKSLPGHTNCSGGLFNEKIFVCGDLIFYGGSVGRYDLSTGSLADLKESLKFCNSLNDDVLVLSGHGQTFKIKDFKPYLV